MSVHAAESGLHTVSDRAAYEIGRADTPFTQHTAENDAAILTHCITYKSAEFLASLARIGQDCAHIYRVRHVYVSVCVSVCVSNHSPDTLTS